MSIKYTFEVELHPVKCPICGTVFAVETAVLEEALVCPRGHSEIDSPVEHAETNNKSPKALQECPICHGEFKSLKQHNRRAHPLTAPE